MSTGDGLTHNTGIVIEQGGNVLDVLSGAVENVEGELDVKSGGVMNFESGSALEVAGVDKTQTLAKAIMAPVAGKMMAGGAHAVTGGEGSAHTCTMATGLTTISAAVVQVIRSGKVATSDASVSYTGGNLVVADGSTYALTSGDVLNWIAYGV